MVFNATSINPRRTCRAWTLPEVLMAMGIMGLVSLAICSAMVFSGRSFQGVNNYVDLDDKSRRSLDMMMNDIRGASLVTYFGSLSNELRINDGNGSPIRFLYDSTTRKLTRTDSISTRTLLTGCDRLAFSMYQRTPPLVTGNWITATNLKDCKLIQVDWSCSRKLYPVGKFNTESVQTAKIVIRNEP